MRWRALWRLRREGARASAASAEIVRDLDELIRRSGRRGEPVRDPALGPGDDRWPGDRCDAGDAAHRDDALPRRGRGLVREPVGHRAEIDSVELLRERERMEHRAARD